MNSHAPRFVESHFYFQLNIEIAFFGPPPRDTTWNSPAVETFTNSPFKAENYAAASSHN